MTKVAYCMPWTESEAGWGTRPDGHSLHLTREDYEEYLKKHWAFYKELYGDRTPHEYSRPDSDRPYAFEADDETYTELEEKRNIRKWENKPPERL